MRYLILHTVFLLLVFRSVAQELNLVLDKEEVKIGEPFTATFSVISDKQLDSIIYSPNKSVFPAKESSENSEVKQDYELEIQNGFSDTVYQEGNKYIWKGSYSLIGWDSAYVIIPPERIYLNDSLYYFPAGLVKINSPKAKPGKQIYDINEDFTEIPEDTFEWTEFLKTHGWWIGLLLILIIALIVKRSRKKKLIEPLSLREKTLREIDELEKGKGYEKDLKEFYFELSVLLRKFLAEHYGIRMLDKTTREIERILDKKGLEKGTIMLVTKILTQSDMVKFARSNPPVSDIFIVTNEARRVVNEVADLDLQINDK